MVSKNNSHLQLQKRGERQLQFGIRKLSVGVASVVLGTVFYMQSGTVHADVNPTVGAGNGSANMVNEHLVTSGSTVGLGASSNVNNSAGSADETANSTTTGQVSAPFTEGTATQVNNNTVSGQESGTPVSQVNVGTDKNENANVTSSPAPVQNSQTSVSSGDTGNEQSDSNLQSLSVGANLTGNTFTLLASKVVQNDAQNDVNGGYDSATWGTLDVSKWTG